MHANYSAMSYDSKSVQIVGLKSRCELNGKKGVAKEQLPNGRIAVTIEDLQIDISVSPDNLIFDCVEEAIDSKANDSKVIAPPPVINLNLKYLQNKSYFYPFGNTPAKLLTKLVPVHQPIAKVLLLACGDPRHILYTAWCKQQAGGLSDKQILHVTTCDIEPSIIARNIILCRLIRNGCNFDMVWSIFYDRVIDAPCMALMTACANDLYSVGDSLKAWHKTEFGCIVKFVDDRTYAIVRDIWSVYGRGNVSKEAAARMCKCVKECNDQIKLRGLKVITAATQAHPCHVSALANEKVHSDIFAEYFSTGRSTGCAYPAKSLSTNFNPTMFTSAYQHANLHYGLDPTLGYHLSLAYAQLMDDRVGIKSDKKIPKKVDKKVIYSLCIRQFSEWCNAMKISMERKQVVIHHFTGDLFDLSYALADTRKNGYENSKVVNSNSGGPVSSLGVPLLYDVIDTSNVSDSVGLLNLLLSSRQLLCKDTHSTILTEFLVSDSGNVNNLEVFLLEMLKTDLPTFAAITGFTLLDTSSKVTSNFKNCGSVPSALIIRNGRINIALEWAYVHSPGLRIQLEPSHFVSVYKEIYMRMFSFSLTLQDPSKAHEYLKNLKYQQSMYTAPSMQTFVRLVLLGFEEFSSVDFETIRDLIDSILGLRLHLQQNHIQNMMTWFAAVGLISAADLNRSFDAALSQIGYLRTAEEKAFFGANPPEMVYLTLLVPREAIEKKLDKLLCPLIEMAIRAMGSDDRFSSMQMQYITEKIDTKMTKGHRNGAFCNNFSVVEGNSTNYKFLACTAIMPISRLAGERVEVSLSLPRAAYMEQRSPVMQVIGPSGVAYSALLTDKTKVSLAAFYPEKIPPKEDLVSFSSDVGEVKGSKWTSLTALVEGGFVKSYATKVQLQDTAFFRSGSMTSCKPVVTGHTTLGISVQLQEGSSTCVKLPVCVNANGSTVQISRKNGYLNILSPLFKNRSPPLLSMYSTARDPPQYSLVGTSRALLDCMPKLDLTALTGTTDTAWLCSLASSQLSPGEAELAEASITSTSHIATDMKESIKIFLMTVTGYNPRTNGGRPKHFFLCTKDSKLGLLLFVNSIRLNFDDGSVLIDAAVCVLTADNIAIMSPWVDDLRRNDRMRITYVSQLELAAWKQSFPAMSERTRNNWTHSSSCEYVASGVDTIPLSKTGGGPVVCSCCLGKGLEGSEFEKEIGATHAAYKQYFRAAISPFFNMKL